MCQMPNIWHICHTKHKKHKISDGLYLIIFATCEQYRCKFAMVRNWCAISFNPFLFSFLSPLSSLYSFLLSHSSSDIMPLHSFFFHSFFFSISLFFSLPLRHHPQFFLLTLFFFHSYLCRCGFFFFLLGSDLILSLAVGGLRW